MRKYIKKATDTIANFLPALISGTELEFFSRTNVTNSQFITLMAIFYAGKCTMGYLAESLHVKMPTVTGLIDRLIRLNLVKRSTSQKDRRKVYVELSQKGTALIIDFKTIVRRRWANLLATLNPSEVKNFQKTFEKLTHNVEHQKNEKKE